MNDREAPGNDHGSEVQLKQLYQEVILDHYRKPRNKGVIEASTHQLTLNNPLCGDVVELQLVVKNGKIVDAAFEGSGCSISQASASMMTERLKGRPVDSALALDQTFTRMLHGDEAAATDEDLGDLRALAGVSRFPVRIKCALLAWNCLEELVGPGS